MFFILSSRKVCLCVSLYLSAILSLNSPVPGPSPFSSFPSSLNSFSSSHSSLPSYSSLSYLIPLYFSSPSLFQAELSGMRACHLRDGAAESEFLAWLEDELANPKGLYYEIRHSCLLLKLFVLIHSPILC